MSDAIPGNGKTIATRVVVFLKAPRPGFVKTRLAARLDPEAAVGIYRVLVDRTLACLHGAAEVEVRFTPDDALEEIRPWLRAGWRCAPQGDGDLGPRLHRAVHDAFEGGVRRVVLLGADCPDLESADIREACDALGQHDVAIGPAEDGGYWLLALRASHPALFSDIPWGTDRVYADTMERAAHEGLAVQALRRLRDIDTLDDWRTWLRERSL